MDSIVNTALDEICSQGVNGLPLRNLWPKLHSPLSSNGLDACSGVKAAIWNNLLTMPCLQFESQGVSYDSQNPRIQSFEDAEELSLKIVTAEHLRNNFVGMYDVKASDAGISQVQRRTLERLAIARTNGVAQSELAKEFGIKGNNIFYVLRNLECRGLIVRQSTVLRKKDGNNNSSIVSTNMLYLHRYAKHLGCQQKLEITQEGKTCMDNENAEVSAGINDGVSEECLREDVQVKDYLPALRAICEKLEKADGKVLVVSDIKRDLGYRGTRGHIAWRNICHRLKDIHVVEEFFGKVNQKEVSCLRLLKKFSSELFEPKSHGGRTDDLDAEQLSKQGKRGHMTDQLLELPIEHQMFDMINREGSKGLTITEVCKRLGLSNKRYYTRLLAMFSRFGMHLEPESLNRGVAYRVWTPGNYNPEVSNNISSELGNGLDENGLDNACFDQEKSVQIIQDDELWISKDDTRTSGEYEDTAAEADISLGSAIVENSLMVLDSSRSQNLARVTSSVPEAELQIVCLKPPSDVNSLEMPASTSKPPCPRSYQKSSSSQSLARETSSTPEPECQIVCTVPASDDPSLGIPCTTSKPLRRRSYQMYPCLNLNAVSAQREHRILEMLQEKKFLLKSELHRQLENLEKEKQTMMGRRTLDRSLNKLQQEGHCKCIRVSVPNVTNCGRSRTMDVVLHPSVFNVTTDLLGQIHERLRTFDLQVRQGSLRQKKGLLVPVLNSIDRTQNSTKLIDQAERFEAMRANGFLFAKMVRTKLLHIFLWGYLNGLPEWDDDLSLGKHECDRRNPHSTWKLLDLDAAIKAMPLELFLQVAGSTNRFEDMVEKCRMGFCLSDLSLQEYKSLMDTQAAGRLSCLVDILRRLKLIRLVSGDHLDTIMVPHTLRYSLELRPYIEEPVATVLPSPDFFPLDLRPHIKHDFVLSNRKAVDEYWKTVEYCYATADPKAALHAFPGSAVHEVFLLRSWTSVRVMTADQRAQLLQRIVTEDRDKKLSFKECEKIAKDLDLTLEQVLRVYSDKRQNRLNRLQGALNAKSSEIQPLKRKRISRKRKTSSEARSKNQVKAGTQVKSSEKRLMETSDDDDQFTEAPNIFTTSLGEHEKHMLSNDNVDHEITDHVEAIEELEENKVSEGDYFSINECALSRLKPARQKKFSWTEDADKQLLIEYVRHRAAFGAKFHRTDWSSLPNLPASPVTCKRRMALLNSSSKFRKAVMRLCNKLSERYAKHLEKFQKKSLGDSCGLMLRKYSKQGDFDGNLSDSDCPKSIDELNSEDQWDDFNNPDIKTTLEEVLQYKQTAKHDAAPGVGSFSEHSGREVDTAGNDLFSSATPSKEVKNSSARRKVSTQRSGRHRVPYIKLINRVKGANRRAYESLAVSNAAELFKLVFLSTATAPEVPKLLAETLRRYSEHDLFAAFNYLRERKIMVGGNSSSPFRLSQPFLQNISSSPFPINTGNRVVKMASWLHERENDMLEEGIDLSADLQCGDIFYLCALVSSGEVSISPFLPGEGVGEAENLRKSKRKSENNEFSGGHKAKKLKTVLGIEGEIISRREKGFPGIRLSLSRATISRMGALMLIGDRDFIASPLGDNDQGETFSSLSFGPSSTPDTVMETLDYVGTSISRSSVSTESQWEAMALYASHLVSLSFNQEQGSPFHPNIFKTVYLAIQKAGDQGLSIEEIAQVIDMQGKTIPEQIVDVLEAFGRALKVNAYDSVHVIDPLYRSKYFLMPMAELHQDVEPDICKGMGNDQPLLRRRESTSLQKDISMNAEEMHRVTILNHPKEIAEPLSGIQNINEMESNKEATVISPITDQGNEMTHFGDSPFCRPILPWINGDGTINEIVYKGLVRRILGIIMQNPGILEANILSQMGVLNPQSCRKLLELMILDNNIVVRKMYHATSAGAPPAILGCLLGNSFKKSKLICQDHFFANPMSISSL